MAQRLDMDRCMHILMPSMTLYLAALCTSTICYLISITPFSRSASISSRPNSPRRG